MEETAINGAHVIPRLVCLDFDGTIIGDGVSPVFLQWMEHLTSKGTIFAINTGRTLFHALQGIQENGIRPLPHYIIAKEREIFAPGPFNRWVDFGEWNQRGIKEHHRLFKSCKKFLKEVKRFVEKETQADFISDHEDPAGIIAVNDEEMDRICEFIDEHTNLPEELSYERNTVYLRFSHIGYNKGTSLSELARMLEISPEHIFAAGDNHNDLSMLDHAHAGMIACPGNSIEEVKSTVDSFGGFTAKLPASEGMIQAFEHFFAA